MPSWFRVEDASDLLSPSLVVDRGLVRENLLKMIEVAQGADRLRPHVKTHKMAAIVRLGGELGITKHKCATIAEAEMVAEAGGTDVLLAYTMVGPNVARLANLIRTYPGTVFRSLVDDPDAASALSAGLTGLDQPHPVLVDLEVGMGRTGIEPGDRAFALYEHVASLPGLVPDGLQAYDGHNQEPDPAKRAEIARPAIEATLRLRDRLVAKGLPVTRLVMGGTPTFPIHAAIDEPGVECSPGTIVLQDVGYATRFPEMPYRIAAAVLTRVISRPRHDRVCLDLGHKAVAADPSGPRATIPELAGATVCVHSEEHLVLGNVDASQYPPGTAFLAFPSHICPTCALHRRAYVVEEGRLVDEWDVTARDRVIRI